MRLALLALAVTVALVLRRRGRTDGPRAVVAWLDGSETRIREGMAGHERLVAAAERALG